MIFKWIKYFLNYGVCVCVCVCVCMCVRVCVCGQSVNPAIKEIYMYEISKFFYTKYSIANSWIYRLLIKP